MQIEVVGLISGGKDSLYALNLIENSCDNSNTQTRYKVVALAHLQPLGGSVENDSYMFQTVGSELVESISECLELPLVTHEITGTPLQTNSISYHGPIQGDEVEDLFLLLNEVLRQKPNVKAVCCGAVLSSYQKHRVEDVCRRLDLISLTPLWGYDQKTLLTEIVNSGIVSIVIKTATIGLGLPDLGKKLVDLYDKLTVLEKKYSIQVCGEGGEYETLVLDAPQFKRRIVIDEYGTLKENEQDTSVDSGNVTLLVPLKWHLEDKENGQKLRYCQSRHCLKENHGFMKYTM